VAFDVKDYAQVDHGYAATIHKAQGMTVDRTFVLATPGMDSHSAYVALSRHREGMELHYGNDDFADQGRLARTLSRDRSKDMASDYASQGEPERGFAERRGITFRERVAEIVSKIVHGKVRGILDGVRLKAPVLEQPAPVKRDVTVTPLDRAIARHAQAVQSIFEMQDRGGEATPEQTRELHSARQQLNGISSDSSSYVEKAYARDATMAPEAAAGSTDRARQAIADGRPKQLTPQQRADQFVERWNKLNDGAQHAYVDGDMSGRNAMRGQMAQMAKALGRDAQLESLLAGRKHELGITFETGHALGAELALNHGIDLGRGLGIGM
ncbi:MAG: Ti-type conjugative transfer relaxase TraA, partial [Sphingomonas sp.]